MEDFNSRTTSDPRTKSMITGKWTRMHGDCQRFNAIYKHLTRKSGESDVDLVHNAKTSFLQRHGNKKFQYVHVWNILKNYLKWSAAKPIDEDNHQELFGPNPREGPADKQRAKKKQKSGNTSSVGGSTRGSTVGSQSESISGVLSQDYRSKCEDEKAYEAKREKELGMLQCREPEFLMIDPSSWPPTKRAIIEMKQAEIMRKYPNATP
uniref:Glutathione S-transferase T3-like n=1 Tax=Tanacetum cinerariifolium TaxID=118510 RepID=A0A6L2LZH4_TANCI|nr:glutathione S-transferase T3-like [Tanacetum cinerariifolium]